MEKVNLSITDFSPRTGGAHAGAKQTPSDPLPPPILQGTIASAGMDR